MSSGRRYCAARDDEDLQEAWGQAAECAARSCALGKPVRLDPMGPASMGLGEMMSK